MDWVPEGQWKEEDQVGLREPAGRLIKMVSGSRQASCVCGPPSHLGPVRRWPTLSFKLTVTASKFLLVFE